MNSRERIVARLELIALILRLPASADLEVDVRRMPGDDYAALTGCDEEMRVGSKRVKDKDLGDGVHVSFWIEPDEAAPPLSDTHSFNPSTDVVISMPTNVTITGSTFGKKPGLRLVKPDEDGAA